jgi:membrane protein DedA with SNARE-associated domain
VSFSITGSVVTLITDVLTIIGLPGLLALMAVESFGIPPIPSEVILPFAGFLVAEGTFPLGATIGVALVGGLAGAYIAYAVGRWWRHHLLGLGVGQLRLREADLARMDTWFARRGEVTVAVARVIPGVRSYISYPAGTARMDPVRFGAYTFAGSLPWTLAMLYAGIVLGSHWNVISEYFLPIDVTLVVLVVATGIYLGLVATGRLTRGWPPRRRPGRDGSVGSARVGATVGAEPPAPGSDRR